MKLDRMGSFHQCRLSFMRTLLRRMKHEAWTFERARFDIDSAGVGTALYTVTTPARTYTLVAFSHDLPDHMRSDRVIATAWDATFALHDGVPTGADLERLRSNVPLQEAGRVSGSRLWSNVLEALAAGNQPDVESVESVGYLMRTTAVYGSGKFGAADRQSIEGRPEFVAPFQAEMLTVFLIRAFALDLVEHMALQISPNAARLEPALRRRFGIGNSTGLGMAPFLITHPRLINNWIAAREQALARVRSVDRGTAAEIAQFSRFVLRAARGVAQWHSEHEIQKAKLVELAGDIDALLAYVTEQDLTAARPWDALVRWAHESLSLEGQELVVSLVLEPYGHLVDELTDHMHADESSLGVIDGSMTAGELRTAIERAYGWALAIDWSQPRADARAWYVSEAKLEPRLGERHDEPIGTYEQPLQPGRDAVRLHGDLGAWHDGATVAEVLRSHPEHRHTVRRLVLIAAAPYGEIQDNTIDAEMLPIDLLRSKLSFFGATDFDPRSDRWVRITMFRGAPFPHELADLDPDTWTYPPVVEGSAA